MLVTHKWNATACTVPSRAKWQWTSSPRENTWSSSSLQVSNQNPTKWRWSNMMTSWHSLELTSQVSEQAQKQEAQLYMIRGLFNSAMVGRSSTSYPSLRTLSGMHCQVNRWHGSECSSMLCQSKKGSSRTFSPWNMWCPSSVITSLTICHIVRQIKMTENEDSGDRLNRTGIGAKMGCWKWV